MSTTPLIDLVRSLADLDQADRGPAFYVLDGEGRTLVDNTVPGHPGAGLDWQIDDSGEVQVQTPAGWAPIVYPFDLYGKADGYLCGLVPAQEQGPWSQVLANIHRLESERRQRDYEMNDLAAEVVNNYSNIDLLTKLPKEANLGLDEESFWDAGLGMVAESTRAAFILLALAQPDGSYKIVAACAEGRPVTRNKHKPKGRERFLGQDFREGLTGRAIAEGRSLLVNRVDEGTTVPAPFEAGAGSLLAVPLISHLQDSTSEVQGAIVLIDRIEEGRGNDETGLVKFNTEVSRVTEMIASQLAGMMGNRALSDIRKEVNIAADLQRTLLPSHNPKVEGFDLAGRCEPARYAGGDYYGYLDLASGGLGCLILDVSGHNLAASLMLPMARAAFDWLGRKGDDPGYIISQASSMLYGNLAAAELFITLFLVALEPGKSQVKVSNAGHNPPLLYRSGTGQSEWLDVDGLIIGMMPESEHGQQEIEMTPGDILVLYTDGVTEVATEGGEMFGEDRLTALISGHAHRSAQDILDTVYEEVRNFGDAGQDDVTLVVIKKE